MFLGTQIYRCAGLIRHRYRGFVITFFAKFPFILDEIFRLVVVCYWLRIALTDSLYHSTASSGGNEMESLKYYILYQTNVRYR